ncbi:helix-turn-helix transcriptional regulator [Amycolatopsis cynarae]|uniref:Helix-turn-helix transcriptional regulator n=1 Tax=Amycolatopsis cynarae TaxID=2995223 RepID=A0ABY7AVX6_9PSEU|nr:helix-turn-helix transcriptional regulator [Amycolatopsis sp. HUAS 11-8]WAL63897.1 helix-turn-helix transcriptional regulator [Amycolatopsis sp. HUAS 11-8]
MSAGFGATLRRLREEAGLSLAALAQQVHYSKGHLSKVESGQKPPSAQLARLCDAAVGAGGALVRLVGPGGPGGEEPEPSDVDGPVWSVGVGPGGAGFFAPGDGSAAEGLSRMTFGVPGAATGTPALLDAFRLRFASARALGQVAGPAAVLPGLIADAQTLRALAATAAASERPALWRLAARYAEYAGWMTQEAGDDRMALWWTDVAVRLAGLGGDATLEPYALVRRADVALYHDDALSTITFAQRAQQAEHATDRVRGLAAQREAQGHALAGDHDACLRALDRSVALLAAAETDPVVLALGSTNTPDLASLIGGWCAYDLGRPDEAAEILDSGITRFAPGSHRARGRYVTRAALAHCAAGELDRACALMNLVLDEVTALDSATIRHDLRELTRVLARWHTHQPARELRQRLLAALRAPQAWS